MLYEQIDMHKPHELADLCVLFSSAEPNKIQDILSTASIEERLIKTVTLMKQELETFRMQSKISK
jgi:ATP-dependent Lon protease